MTPHYILDLSNDFQFFNENFVFDAYLFDFFDYSNFLYLWTNSNYNFLQIFDTKNEHSRVLINFINKVENVDLYNNIESITIIYYSSVPNTKLFYPEPFIVSLPFVHSDLWFAHILFYQPHLWLILFFSWKLI